MLAKIELVRIGLLTALAVTDDAGPAVIGDDVAVLGRGAADGVV